MKVKQNSVEHFFVWFGFVIKLYSVSHLYFFVCDLCFYLDLQTFLPSLDLCKAPNNPAGVKWTWFSCSLSLVIRTLNAFLLECVNQIDPDWPQSDTFIF